MPKDTEKQRGMTPQQAANEVQPGAKISADPDSDPREEANLDDPQSSAQKLPEPPGSDRS
jgi:hypothetical protein